ncbi:MAG: hypothetical protein COB53_03650 [Elusimicrobia bacterium]|nr:MAG: hypothetical protein COB53_03650 [Elusimicrobiota bacterium]
MVRLLVGLLFLVSIPRDASAFKLFGKDTSGTVLNDKEFDAIKKIIFIAGHSPQPAKRDILMAKLERSITASRCWRTIGHKKAAAKFGLERAPEDSGGIMPWDIRSKLGKGDPSIGVLVFWIVWEDPKHRKIKVGYAGKTGKLFDTSVNYSARRRKRDRFREKEKKGLFVEETAQEYAEHSIEAKLYSAVSGKEVWSSRWSDMVTPMDYEQSYDDRIKPEDYRRREFNKAITKIKYGLVKPKGRDEECLATANQPWANAAKKRVRKSPFAGLDAAARAKLASSMGKRGRESSVGDLLGSLRDPDLRVRAAAADSLGKIGRDDAVSPLTKALRSKSALLRAVAARALGRIGDAEPKARLLRMAKSDPNAKVRKAARDAAGKIRDPGTVGDLDGFMKDLNMKGN